MDQNKKAILALIISTSIWGLSFLAAKLTLNDIPPFTMAVLRFMIAVIIMIPFGIRQKIRFKTLFSPIILLTGLIGIAVVYGFQNYGISMTTSGNSALIFAGAPAITVLFSFLFLREDISSQMIFGVLLSIVGVVLLIDFGALNTNRDMFWGNVLVFISMVGDGFYIILVKLASKKHSTMEITLGSFIVGMLFMLPFAVNEWFTGSPPDFNLSSIGGLLYLAVLCSSLAYPLWNFGIKFVKASMSAPFINLIPVIGFFASVVIGEPVSWVQVAGGLVTIAGVYICTLKQGEKKPEVVSP